MWRIVEMKNIRVRIRNLLAALILTACLFTPVGLQTSYAAGSPGVQYKAHVQSLGWSKNWSQNGSIAGTTGKGYRMEAIIIKSSSVQLKYRVHVAGIGWQSWVTNGKKAGTTGRSKAIEAVQIKLTGKSARKYDVYYSVHVRNRGWLGWAKNGEVAGSTGMALRTEAVKIKVVKKGTRVNTGSRASLSKPKLAYRAHCAGTGWQSSVLEGKTAGTTGQARRIEALNISFRNFDGNNGITYRAHVAGTGWQSWKTSGKLAGTTGKSKAIEAMQIKLAGGMGGFFDIYYRMHVKGYGWLGWAKNGAVAGTTGGGVQAEAIQIKIVPKDSGFAAGGAAYLDLSCQKAEWFMSAVNISQATNTGSHLGTQNFDVIGYYDNNIYAPFDCKVVAIYDSMYSMGHTVVIESLNKVRYANGTIDYMSMSFGHDDDISDLYVGKVLSKGTVFYQTGNYGISTGSHSHVTCIRGKYQGDMWTTNQYGNDCSPNAIHPTAALFIPRNMKVVSTAGMSFVVE